MLPYEKALETILALPFTPATERIPLMAAAGRILAEPPTAPFDQPRFDNSAMDGYAVRSEDLGSGQTSLPVAGESAAGRRFPGVVPPGHCLHISTGAPVPPELDCIVPLEETTRDGGIVTFATSVRPGLYRRRQGSDVQAGSQLLAKGRMIGSAELGFLASFNLPTVEVFVRPRVAILTGGNELKPLGGELGDDDLIGSSLYYLEEELKQCGCEPRQFGIAKDDLEDYMTRFAAALEWADLIVTTAGVSVGAHDLVGEVIERFSGHVHFWRVAVRPGKPMLVASYGSCHHFGFPGNPVSTCCNVEIFLKPFLRQAFGMAQPIAEVLPLRLAEPCPRDHARLFFVYSSIERAEDGAQVVRPLPNQNSGNFSLCANANALIVSQPAPDPIPSGAAVPVIPVTRGL